VDQPAISPTIDSPIGNWTNEEDGGVNWSLGNPADIILASGQSSDYLKGLVFNGANGEYQFQLSINSTSSVPLSGEITVTMVYTNGNVSPAQIINGLPSTAGDTHIITIGGVPDFIRIKIHNASGSSSIFTVTEFSLIRFSPQAQINDSYPGLCYQDISFILATANTYIGSIGLWHDDGIGFRPWVNAATSQHVALTSFSVSNDLIDGISNPFIGTYEFIFSAQGTINGGGGNTAQFTISLYDADGNFINASSPVNIPNTHAVNLPISVSSLGTLPATVHITVNNLTGSTNTVTVTNITLTNAQILILRKQYSDRIDDDTISIKGIGLYRVPLNLDRNYESVDVSLLFNGNVISELKTIEINSDCSNQVLKMTWLNNLGGFDYWNFTAQKDYQTEVTDTGETGINKLLDWPKSYGEDADTMDRRQTYRDSVESILIRSQHLTLAQVQAISYIKKSVLVQIINSRSDRRTVIIDTDSFVAYKDEDKLYTLSFTAKYTDNNPAQRA
jgi:hypothetical protein